MIKNLLKKGTLLPLEKFIMQPRPTATAMDDKSAQDLIYGEGWGLFHYLYRTNRPGLEKFLMSYNALQPLRPIGPEQARKLFTDAFGEKLDDLDKKFQAYLKSLPTPTPVAR